MRENGTALYRIGSGASMILAPLLWLTSTALGPRHDDSQHLADALPHIAADPDRFLAFILLGLLSHVLFIPALFGVAHLVKGPRRVLAHLGAALVTLGVFCLVVIEGIQLVQHQMIDPAVNREEMASLLKRLEAGTGMKVVFGIMLLGLLAGWVTMFVGVLGTGLVPRLVPASFIVHLVLSLAGQDVLSRVVLVLGFSWLGVVVLRMTDEGWAGLEPSAAVSAPD